MSFRTKMFMISRTKSKQELPEVNLSNIFFFFISHKSNESSHCLSFMFAHRSSTSNTNNKLQDISGTCNVERTKRVMEKQFQHDIKVKKNKSKLLKRNKIREDCDWEEVKEYNKKK
ncbi:CLUMA_CG018539, isoform A [Clunio marinus]|uniref:CLUMA_CG018539, isoform A n=1 Tax=Clunio marinus TaxID=568069 RepID=A0A1J1IZG2_9DIPT|nr:CLUMA_CG018539, isoform A [Clunio marinus]